MLLMNEKKMIIFNFCSKYENDISNTWNVINKSFKYKKQNNLPKTFTQNDTFYNSSFNEYFINILLSDMDKPFKRYKQTSNKCFQF